MTDAEVMAKAVTLPIQEALDLVKLHAFATCTPTKGMSARFMEFRDTCPTEWAVLLERLKNEKPPGGYNAGSV